MRICLLGSGSKGNSLYVESHSTAIIIDQGFSYSEFEKRMCSRGLDVKKIKAIFVSHEHSDHVGGVGVTARRLNIPVYGTKGTLYKNKNIFNGAEELISIESGIDFSLSPFEIHPFSVSHDAADPVQFSIRSGKKKLTIATDLGFISTLVEQQLRDSDIIIIEANHDIDMLKKGSYPWELKQRILSRTGHLSNRNAAEIIFNISLDKKISPRVILAHVSEENNRPELAEREILSLFENFDKSISSLIVAPQHEATFIIEL